MALLIRIVHPDKALLLGRGGWHWEGLCFTPIPGEMIQFDEHIVQRGWFNHQLEVFDDFSPPAITLPETNVFAPENGWLEYSLPIGFRPIFKGETLVSGRV